MSRLDRITTDPAICHGQPVVRGLRYPVADLLDLLAAGMSIDEVLGDYYHWLCSAHTSTQSLTFSTGLGSSSCRTTG